jgi:hypothetical protein
MTKKEEAIQSRILDVLEANTRALGMVFEVLGKIAKNPPRACSTKTEKPEAPEQEEVPQKEAEPEEVPQNEAEPEEVPQNEAESEEPEIDIEYCRKAMRAIQTRISKEEAKKFLASFDGATTIPKLDKKHYAAFIEGAKNIMTGV